MVDEMIPMPAAVQINMIRQDQAQLNVTWAGQNGDMPDPVSFDSTDGDVKGWAEEAVRTGYVPGIRADRTATFADFVVDRFPATADRPFNRLILRPKTPFGR